MEIWSRIKDWFADPGDDFPASVPERPPVPGGIILQGQAGYPVHEVIIHTTATDKDWWRGKTAHEMMAEIRDWHVKQNGWSREGYHGLLAPDGSYAAGRPFTMIGAHCKERNRGTLGLVLVPVADVDPFRVKTFEDYYTADQRAALRAKIRAISAMTQLKWVTGHNDYTQAKTCPGFHVEQEDWL